MKDMISSWASESIENERELQRQELIIEVAESICAKMEERNINRSTLAKILGKTTSLVTQLLTGSRNMTLVTLSDLAFSLGATVKVSVVDNKAIDELDYELYELQESLAYQHLKLPEDMSMECGNDEVYMGTVTSIGQLRLEAA